MDFFTIHVTLETLEQKSQFYGYLGEVVKDLHKGAVQSKWYHLPNKMLLLETVIKILPKRKSKNHTVLTAIVKDKLSDALSRFLIDTKEEAILKRMISKRYSFSEQTDYEAVEVLCCKLLETGIDGMHSRENHIEEIKTSLGKFLESTPCLNLDGFVRFRMREYEDTLKGIVDYAVEEYLLDQQYDEFISLLQYFVYFQEPLTSLVHLMHKKDHDFSILNEHFTPIKAPPASGMVARMADQELEMEDVVVSTLIALSPDRVLIHTLEPEALIISTIRRIFGDRVVLCSDCPQCSMFHHENRRRDQGT
ncbi:putative sporulation protein YtxC [Fontibacillus panacisegetis]|uniref:Putative sporulation protein YtxC n=1 Tax=Fontibacillus panacisegetis TaxID=670482 RepID=A0A1G7PA70_9BACL|nr:putative sporulation protein YtxC [Fontibacillus panacisegetis]SDF83215.1 putative sporulation protein YtxC [Fontibacillus panacisegetis]